MSTYLAMNKPSTQPLPVPPQAMTAKRRAIAIRAWAAKALLTLVRPVVGGTPPVARRARRRAALTW